MPTFKVKPESMGGMVPSATKNKKTYPTVCLPVSPEILAALELDQPVEVTLKGKVCGLESSQNQNYDRNELRVELREVSAYPDDNPGDDEEAEEQPAKKKGMKQAIDASLGYKDQAE